MPMISVIDNLK